MAKDPPRTAAHGDARPFIRVVGEDPRRSAHVSSEPSESLSAIDLLARLEEEVNRAERHRTALSCLLISLDEVEQLSRTHGQELPAQALAYLGTALRRELRRFDRIGRPAEGELLVILPGADERRGEIVARRALSRLHAVKIEVHGKRSPLRISVGIAAWREGLTAADLISQTRLAARREDRSDRQAIEPKGGPAGNPDELPLLRRP